MSNLKTTIDFIQHQAKFLAGRYKSKNLFDDLMQEGVVVGLTLFEQGITDQKKLSQAMRRRMNDYTNFDNKTVPIKASGASREARSKVLRGDTSQEGLGGLYDAIIASGDTTELQEDTVDHMSDHVGDYEEDEYLQYVLCVMDDVLDTEEYELVVNHYLNGYSQGDLAEVLGVKQQMVAKTLKKALTKVRESIYTQQEIKQKDFW